MNHPLTRVEALLLTKLAQRDHEITQLYIQPLQEEYEILFEEIANRLGLSVADLGSLYTVDAETMSVRSLEQET